MAGHSAARCGGPGIDLKVSSTIGYERAHQEVLGVVDGGASSSLAILAGSAAAAELPRHRGHQHGPLPAPAHRSADSAPGRAASARRRSVVDVRTELQFDDAHIPGAICITVLRAGLRLAPGVAGRPRQPVVVVGRDDDDARGAIGLAARSASPTSAGYLAGG